MFLNAITVEEQVMGRTSRGRPIHLAWSAEDDAAATAQRIALRDVTRAACTRLYRGQSVEDCLDEAMRSEAFTQVAKGPFMRAREGYTFVETARREINRRFSRSVGMIVRGGLADLRAMLKLQEPMEKAVFFLFFPMWLGERSLVDLVYDVTFPSIYTGALADYLAGSIALQMLFQCSAESMPGTATKDLARSFRDGVAAFLAVARMPPDVAKKAIDNQREGVHALLERSRGSTA